MMPTPDVEQLLAHWEDLAGSLADGYAFDLDEYLNDLDGRRLLDALPDGPMRARLEAADAQVRQATTPFPVCLWGSRNAAEQGYDRERHWYYFAVPTRRSEAFEADLRGLR